ncbi:MAG: hypothetical protein A2W23_00505 [Planctomycetes bacterium RBG_16_43_13]|nr:MAG: hypothetical protein A2W23_00505 [Planctomycetes bacterium RBG_16_43_13]
MVSRNILIVDDEQSICDVISVVLRKEGYAVTTTTSPKDAIRIFKKTAFDVVIQDIKMPEMDGIELLKTLKEINSEAIVVIMTACSTWERAVEAMRLGAFGYIKKPFDTNLDIRITVVRALHLKDVQAETKKTFDEAVRATGLMIGSSDQMKLVYDLIRRTAPTDSTVTIQGESGVGKELVARALHYGSSRLNKPFIAVNCGAFTETLLESELFGHIKGAFTGAVADKVGLLEVADKGTFFLDEVSDTSPQLQIKLLRVLEEREFKPVGGTANKKVDIRLITATNKDLEQEVKNGNFRKDLYYRLNVIPIAIPPLRDRREDIPLLSGYFLSKFAKQMHKNVHRFTEDAKFALMDYKWPGNIRELENTIQRAVALSEGEEISKDDLFEHIGQISLPQTTTVSKLTQDGADLEKIIGDVEMDYLKDAVKLSDGNHTKASQLLRMSLSSFRYKLQKYGLDKI